MFFQDWRIEIKIALHNFILKIEKYSKRKNDEINLQSMFRPQFLAQIQILNQVHSIARVYYLDFTKHS